MLNKLLFKNQDKVQLLIAVVGAFLGVTFLVSSVHYIIKINEFGEGSDIIGPNTLIVQKKVTNSNSLNLAKTDFSESEIRKMENESFIEEIKPVINNNFSISFETSDPLVPYFRSDVFIQSVDQKFLDVKSNKWKWKPGDRFVPMIMPREFLVMLNTFMSASGIPQISDDLAMDVKFKFKLWNAQKEEKVKVRIIGFTNEVSSLLVPESFMQYGNATYAEGTEHKITQIMISSKESEFGLVEELLKKKGLESKNAQMLVGRLKSVVGTLFMIVFGISIIAVLASGLVLIQYLQLLMSRNSYEIQTLLRIGYDPKDIIWSFFRYFAKIFGGISAIGFLAFLVLKFFLDLLFESGGLSIETSIDVLTILMILLAYLLFVLSSYKTAKRGVCRQF
jgi:ABC-type antimicrobial peptide transport system permease subunit